jgi:membrane-bound serine protease (ClpP class)
MMHVNAMGRIWKAVRALVCAALVMGLTAAAARAQGVTHVRIDGELDRGTLALLQRTIRAARGAGHDHLLIEVDTPGGSVEIMWQLAKSLHEAYEDGLTTTAWVNESALSAGVLLTLACENIYMRGRGTIGSAAPILVGPGGGLIEMEPEVREKTNSALRGQFRTCADWHGRPPQLAEAMVDENVEVRQVREDGALRLITGSEWDDMRERGHPPELVRTVCPAGVLLNLTGPEAVELGFVDGLAETKEEVLEKIGISGAVPTVIERSRSEDILGGLGEWRFLLIAAGLVLAFLELKMPGFGLPGILSIACFMLVFLVGYMVGLADIPHIVLAAVGVTLIAVELFLVPGTMWVGLTGGVLLLAGLVLGQLGPGFELANDLDRQLAFDSTFRLSLSAVGALVAMVVLSRYLPNTPILRHMVQLPADTQPAFAGAMQEATGAHAGAARVGAVGITITALRPVGKVRLDANAAIDFEASAPGVPLEPGARVTVVEVNAGRLVVEAFVDKEAT